MELNRRLALLGGVGAAGLLVPQRRALANTPFANFPVTATGSTTGRTIPNRLSDIKNVLDFGADPTGATDSTTAIQNAVNSLSGAGRGTIFFPVGSYVVSAPITYNYAGDLGIHFLGADGRGSQIGGNFPGFLFDRHNVNAGSPSYTTGGRVFEKLSFGNSHTSGGCVRIGSTIGGAFRDCTFSGYTCLTTEDSAGNSSQGIFIENCTFVSPGSATPQENIIIGGSGAVIGCDFHNVQTAMRIYGSGLFMAGNRVEQASTAYLIGLDSAGSAAGASAFVINSGSTEACTTAVDLGGNDVAPGICSGFLITTGANGRQKGESGYPLNTIDSQYGFRIRPGAAPSGVFRNCTTTGALHIGGIVIGAASSRASLVFLACTGFQNGDTGANWVLPSNAYTATFDNCNIQPVWTFSQLPSGGNVLEGDEFNISDGNSATWGANVTAGGSSNRVLVRWNGSNWTVVGK